MGTKSFASGNNDYVAVQAVVQGDSLHIQGIGPSVNRPYGVAVDLTAPSDLVTWFKGLPRTNPSGTGSKNRYAPMQTALRSGKVHFQVNGPSLNRTYGAAFDADSVELTTFINAVAEAEEAAAQAAPQITLS